MLFQNTTSKENVTLLAIGTAYVQGEDVAARGRVILFSVDRNPDNLETQVTLDHFILCIYSASLFLFLPQQTQPLSRFVAFCFSPFQILRNAVGYVMIFYPSQVSEVYSKELKGAISAVAALQGHLLIASGPKIIMHKWTGSELNGVAFFDVPPLHVVSLNIVRIASICHEFVASLILVCHAIKLHESGS